MYFFFEMDEIFFWKFTDQGSVVLVSNFLFENFSNMSQIS